MASYCEHSDTEAHLSTSDNQLNMDVWNIELMNYEAERIKSFLSWPIHYPVDAIRLAKAGFYYTGTEDEVVCFSCQGHVKNWTYGDIVLKKHSDLYPDCDFIRNASNNVHLSKTSLEVKQKLACNIDSYSKVMHISFDVDYGKMTLESERIKTFEKWPESNVRVADLAEAGFFYTGINDKIQCAFCRKIVSNLQTKVEYMKYLKHFPWCGYFSHEPRPFALGAMNETLAFEATNETPWFAGSFQDLCGNMKPVASAFENASFANKLIENNPQQYNLEDLGIYLHKNPVYPSYASLTVRLATFKSWPCNAPVSKEDLAAAGFFHIGVADKTVCFHCNGGLKNWEAGDDPWVEHARWFSGCNFVRLNKGSDFVMACLLKTTSTFLDENDVSSESYDSESLLKKLDEAMKSKIVKDLAETGIFPPYFIRTAVLLQIKHTGSNFSSYEDLCVAATYLKDEIEQQHFDEKTANAEGLNVQLSRPSIIRDVIRKHIEYHSSSRTSDRQDNLTRESRLIRGAGRNKHTLQEDEKKEIYNCKICMDKELGVVFLPCGHLLACSVCAPAIKKCPLCRKEIQATARCYLH